MRFIFATVLSFLFIPKFVFAGKSSVKNPLTVEAKIHFTNTDNDTHYLTIHNSDGDLVLSKSNFKGSKLAIRRGRLEKGLYTYQLFNLKKGTVISGKFVIN